MGISNKTRKILWGSFAGHCAICDVDLIKNFLDSSSPKTTLIGQEAHIIAQSKGGACWKDNYDKVEAACQTY